MQTLIAEFNGPDDQDAFDYLWDRGFILEDDCWIAPAKLALKDARAIVFLHRQWGYPIDVEHALEISPPLTWRH